MFSYVPWLSPLPADKVFAIFGSLMAIVETLNGLGVAFTSNPMGSKQEAGKILVLASLGLQICVIISFFMMSIMFHVRCVKANVCSRVISTLPFTLYVSMALIVIRSIYRVVEHTGNTSLDISNEQELQSLSPLLRYEWYLYVFEATTMLLNSLLWNAFNASRFLPRSSKVFLAEDGTTEMTVLDESTTGDQPAAAQIGRLMMQLLTFGLWGQIFPKRRSSKEESFEKTSEPESTGSFHQV